MIKLYDRVLLKTGETASIAEIYEQGKVYEADIDKEDGDIETDTISQEDIVKVVNRPNDNWDDEVFTDD
ncbi:hypothetical protein [Anaerovibrio sp. RM50]|uniref:hypothetical protein n=1 Tax=Anaerovibrio sp. RM50 TaxID=1200557 RepID=UPI0005636562|nr:hypothetical protein [Anaerovibrio sp. RM50]